MHKCEIYVWSKIGHTPITHRQGSYYDTLYHETIAVENPEQARNIVRRLLAETPHADGAHYEIPTWWNQNRRSDWISRNS